MPVAWLVLGTLGLLLLAGRSGLREAISATPSSTPESVQVTLQVAQQGTVEAQTLKLIASIIVTNHRSQAIGIMDNLGFVPSYVQFRIYTVLGGVKVWDNAFYFSGACSFSCPPPTDVATLTAGSSQTWTTAIDIFNPPPKVASRIQGPGLQPGVTYRAVATIVWHAGSLSANPYETSVMPASGQAEITLV